MKDYQNTWEHIMNIKHKKGIPQKTNIAFGYWFITNMICAVK